MLRQALLSAAFALCTTGVFAQSEIGQWSIQPKAGINVATMTNSDGGDARVGFVGGAELEYRATSQFALSFGALYSQQGIKANTDEGNGTIKMDYINVPILANIYVYKGLALKFGVQPGFKVNSKIQVAANGVSAELDLEQALRAGDVDDASVKSVDLAIPVGVSYCYKNFQFDARYNFGVTNAITADGDGTKNSVFQFTLGYKFAL